MENQENGDTDAKKTVEGTAQDYPMARYVSLKMCLSTCLCNVGILLTNCFTTCTTVYGGHGNSQL